MPSANDANTKPPASFVSGIAWSFIGLSALTILLAAIQYLLFAHMVPIEPLRAVFADAISLKLLPPSTLSLLDYLPGICIALFIASLLTLLISVALLKRKNWARITFAWIMIATAILHVAGLLLPFYFMHDFSTAINSMPPELRSAATAVTSFISVISVVMGIAFAGVFAWIAKRLLSAEIKREFLVRNSTRYL